MTDFHDYIGTTERSQEKIEESVMTLLHVVNKESDILFRKKKQVAAETLWETSEVYRLRWSKLV